MDGEKRNRLFVGNLDFRLLKHQLSAIFMEFGELTDVFLPHSRNEDTPEKLNQGYGFVEFVDSVSAEQALRILNETADPFFGRKLIIKDATQRKSR